ncbi:MAG: hypothetical protein HFJ04_08300 [Lachnospiraceae bacterium]|nr:hypothetical protein [Lachnospiraceae bacterium]
MKKLRKYLILLLLAAIFTGTISASSRIVHAGTKEDFHLSLTVFGKITTQTDKVRVYVDQDGATLKITNASGTIFQKKYKHRGKKTISIPLQKANAKLEFILTRKDGLVFYAARTVKDDGFISKKRENPSSKKPVVAGEITDKSTSVKVYARKGETLYIQNGAKVIRKVSYKKSGYRNISIKKQKAETKLTFYTANKKGRSAYVTKEVQDVTPPKKPKVSFPFEKDCTWIDVEGERGCDVYIRHNSRHKTGRWEYMGTLENTLPETFIIEDLVNIKSVDAGDTFSIRLVDDAGNKSKTATTEKVKVGWHPIY